MSKSIYEEAIEIMKLNILPRESGKTSKTKVIHALQQAQKQKKLLELYEKLAEHRLIVINYLLDEIMDLRYFDTIKDGIDYIMVEAKNYGNEDIKIDEEIEKIKELENE